MSRRLYKAVLVLLVHGLSHPATSFAVEESQSRIHGDLGGFVNAAQSPVRGGRKRVMLLPYAYFDYGSTYVRLDTFGVKTLPIGYGHLELAGRIKFDGYQTAGNAALQGINDRQNSIPVGLGSFQLTPIGGFFLYAFHDVNRSQGNLYEAVYVAKFALGEAAVYPQIGIELNSGKYNQYYYGVSASESAASGYAAYTPSASTSPLLKVMLEVPLAEGWYANLYLRRKWLGAAIANSPLAGRKNEDNGFVGVAFRFK